MLEEDIALTNVALDLLGHARMWLGYAGELEGRGRDEDALAFWRDAGEFRNLLLVEQPNGDFGDTMARQFYFDLWHRLALSELARHPDARVAAIAAKAGREVAYHCRRSGEWILRLGDGTAESHARIQRSLDELWMYTGEMFEGFEALRPLWLEPVRATLARATLTLPAESYMQSGGSRGVHTEKLGYILAEMQTLPRSFPGAKW